MNGKTITNALNNIHRHIPTYFVLEDYVDNEKIIYTNSHNKNTYVVLVALGSTLMPSIKAEVSQYQRKGHIVTVLPFSESFDKKYVEAKVADDPRYDRRNYFNIKEDFGHIDFSNFYSDVAPIKSELGISIEAKFEINKAHDEKINQVINEKGELELFLIKEGKDIDGPRSDLFDITRILETEMKENKWTFYTPQFSQDAIIGPINNTYLLRVFKQHLKN